MEAPRKVSQQELADACGMTQATVSRLLSGQEPKSSDLYAISKFFGVPMEWMLVGDEPDGSNLKVAEAAVEYGKVSRLTKEGMQAIYESLDDLNEKLQKMRLDLGEASEVRRRGKSSEWDDTAN